MSHIAARRPARLSPLACLFAFLGFICAGAPSAQPSGASSTIAFNLHCDYATGLWNWEWVTGAEMRGLFCAARLANGTRLASSDYTRHDKPVIDHVTFTDVFGKGTKITVHHRAAGKPELLQEFWCYDHQDFFLTRLTLVSPVPVACNWLAPLVLDLQTSAGVGVVLDSFTSSTLRVLGVPFDNDNWVRFNGKPSSPADPDSYEVTALYDNATRHGFVIGSVDHDLWKTGIEARDLAPGAARRLCVYAGAASPGSRDAAPHGTVTSTTISSPRIFVGCFKDWRDGLEAYGRANATLHPPLPWAGGVPFGWNSWAAYGMKIDLPRYLAVSDFLAKTLQPNGFNNQGAVYLNWDSGWNRLREEQLLEGVRHLHANGQKAGIYLAPWGYWGNNLDRRVEGSSGTLHYRDLALCGPDGQPLPKLDGAWRLDPTHPFIIERTRAQLRKFVQWGYEYVKLDFLNFAAAEARHYDPAITTGAAAYTAAMKRISDELDPRKIGRPFFISLSIAPLFPGGAGHARRVSCDAFGALKDTEYLLNSLTYGWWMNGTLQPFNDPDHIVLYNKDKPASEAAARSRVNASAIAGTVMIDSDDLADPAAAERAARLLTNEEVNAVARAGRTFRPVEGDTGSRAADLFERRDASDLVYLAVFNFSPDQRTVKRIDLARAGLAPDATWRVRDLWTKQERRARATLELDLEPAASTILRLEREPQAPLR